MDKMDSLLRFNKPGRTTTVPKAVSSRFETGRPGCFVFPLSPLFFSARGFWFVVLFFINVSSVFQ